MTDAPEPLGAPDSDSPETTPPGGSTARPVLPVSVPQQVDGYQILRQIGEGGMGIVCEAQQAEPRRRVALKLIKHTLEATDAIVRMELEREALALMDHAHVAQIYDAGYYGRHPYFVMELIPGEPINVYCARNDLGLRERLELFAQVCEGIQHAHSKGIIHRDVSARNVLVFGPVERPCAKVIDFGVAKTIGRPLTERGPVTIAELLPVTMEYMSPELASGELDRVDASTDIYSLGVLLFELLTGALPFDSKRLRSASHGERERIIVQENPPRPSASLAGRTEAVPTYSARELKGDLDWIVLKALSKSPRRRYPSASEFGADVRRFLNDRPVVARPESSLYRFRKWCVREPALAWTLITLIATAAVLVAVLIVSYVTLTAANENLRGEMAKRTSEANAARIAEARTNELISERDQLQREIYARQIRNAQEDIERGDIERARKILSECLPRARGWEWRFLSGLIDESRLTLGRSGAGLSSVTGSVRRGIVLAGAADGSVWAWVIDPAGLRYSIQPHQAPIVDLVVSPDGQHAASVAADGSWYRWNPRSDGLHDGVGNSPFGESGKVSFLSRRGETSQRVAAIRPDAAAYCWLAEDGPRIVSLSDSSQRVLETQPGLDFDLSNNAHQTLWVTWDGDELWVLVGRLAHPGGKESTVQRPLTEDEGWLLCWGSDLEEIPARRRKVLAPTPGARLEVADSLALIAAGGHAHLYDLNNPDASPETLHVHSEIRSLALSADGALLALGTGSRSIRLWDVHARKFVDDANESISSAGSLFGHEGSIEALDFRSFSDLISASSDGTARVWSPSPAEWVTPLGAPPSRLPDDDPPGAEHVADRVRFSGDASHAISATKEPAVLRIDARTATVTTRYNPPDWERILAMDPGPDGRRIRLLIARKPQGAVDSPAPDASPLPIELVEFDFEQGAVVSGIPLDLQPAEAPTAADISFEGERVAVAIKARGEKAPAVFVFVRRGANQYSLEHALSVEAEHIEMVRFDDKGLSLAAIGNHPNRDRSTVCMWDLRSGERLWCKNPGSFELRCLAFTHAGDRLLVGTNVRRILSFGVSSGMSKFFETRDVAINSIAVSPDDHKLLTGSEDAQSRIWDLRSGSLLMELPDGNRGFIPEVAWASDDSSLAVAGGDDMHTLLYRCPPRPETSGAALALQMLQERGTVYDARRRVGELTLVELKRRFDEHDDDELKEAKSRAQQRLNALSDDPEYLNTRAWGIVQDLSVDRLVDDSSPRPKGDRFEEARDLAWIALQVRRSWVYQRTRGLAFLNLGDYSAALHGFTSALEHATGRDRAGLLALSGIARALEARAAGRWDESARRSLAKVLADLPANQEAEEPPDHSPNEGFLKVAKELLERL